ncbi:pinoid-binding protein 1, partial [Prunus dulcis]
MQLADSSVLENIGGSLCAAMLTCVLVYPLLCGHYGAVSVPFAGKIIVLDYTGFKLIFPVFV